MSVTAVSTVAEMGWVSCRKVNSSTPRPAPQLTPEEDAGPALHPEEIEEVHPRKPPSRMLVVSPTRWRLPAGWRRPQWR